MTILSRLDELKKITDAATRGPWLPWDCQVSHCSKCDHTDWRPGVMLGPNGETIALEELADAQLIKESRTAMPQLIEALRVAVDKIRELSEGIHSERCSGGHTEADCVNSDLKGIAQILEVGE